VLVETTHVAEVEYFTRLAVQDPNNPAEWLWKNVAIVTVFSHPDPNLFKLSYRTVYACWRQEEDVRVIDVSTITGVVGMVPHDFTEIGRCHFMVERPGLDIATFGVPYEAEGAQDDMADDNDDEPGSN